MIPMKTVFRGPDTGKGPQNGKQEKHENRKTTKHKNIFNSLFYHEKILS